ncbi:MAG: MBL fold metallo-hydrolase [Flavobacteriaceae bacterium]|nr:MBL fold metallo-hydrolase [Flavobacteriaceae bacterium]
MNLRRTTILALTSLILFACNTQEKKHKHGNDTHTHEATNPYVHEGPPTIDVLYNGYVKPIEGKTFLPGAQPDGARKAASTISLIRTKDMVMVTDPGMTAEGDWDSLIHTMKNLGVSKEDVTHVFISHHHPDHNTRVGVFPNATVVDFWATYKNDDWNDHPDKFEISEGVTVVKTPGHTHEDASLLVETKAGTYFLTHMWWNDQFGPDKDPLAQDQATLDKNRAEWVHQVDWIVPGHGKMFKNPKKIERTIAEQEVLKASSVWIKNFNKGNVDYCVNHYTKDAVMTAKPFGTFKGGTAIDGFWDPFVKSGAGYLVYRNTIVKEINLTTVHLSSNWSMNVGEGIITKEEWVKGTDNVWLLKIDNFEVLKQYKE